MMANQKKRKKRLSKAIARRSRVIEKIKLDKAWHRYWVKVGILKG